NAVPRGEQIRFEAIVAGSDRGAGTEILIAAVFKQKLRDHAHGRLPIGIAIRVEMTVVGGIRGCGGLERPSRRRSAAMGNRANLKRRFAGSGRARFRLVFQNSGFGKDGAAPEVPVVEKATAAVRSGAIR